MKNMSAREPRDQVEFNIQGRGIGTYDEGTHRRAGQNRYLAS